MLIRLILALLIAAVLADGASAQTYQVDAAHTGNASGARLGATLTPVWSIRTTEGGTDYAVVAPGRVYTVGVVDGRAVALALDSASGAPLWAVPLAEQWDEGPYVTLAGDRLIASAGNVIAAVDVASGAVLWARVVAGTVSPPVVSDGLVLATMWTNSYGSQVQALRLADGTPAWTGERTSGFGGATVAAGTVLNMAGCGALASRIADGTTAWAQDPTCGGRGVNSSFDGERIWAGNHTRGKLHDPATGASTGLYEGGVPALSGDLAVVLQAGSLVARDRHTLAERWRFTPPGPLVTAPLIADGVVYAADDPGHVYSVDLATGALLATAATGARTNWQGSIAPGLAAGDGLLIVPTESGIVALRGSGAPPPTSLGTAATPATPTTTRGPAPTTAAQAVRALADRAARALSADRKRLAKAKGRRAAAVAALRRLDALRREAAKVTGTAELRRALALHRRGLVRYRSGHVRSGRQLLARAALSVRAIRRT